MKKATIQLFILIMCCFVQTIEARTFTIPAGVEWIKQMNNLAPGTCNVVYNALQVNIIGGDSLQFDNGTRGSLRVDDLLGDSLNPIVICNKDGKVIVTNPTTGYYGITFNNCRYIHVSGNNNPAIPYGILITQFTSGSALSINNYSSNFEVQGVEVSHVASCGIVAKTDPSCANYTTYGNFIMYDLKFHHNYIHHTGNEGFYVGNTSYGEGSGARLSCSNPNVVVNIKPHKIIGVNIYQNICDSNGWDGIQVSAASNAEIHDNYVIHDSYADVAGQASGIMIGEPAIVNVYNNSIRDGKGLGIQCFGVGSSFYNNLIVNPANSRLVRGTYNSNGVLQNATLSYGIYINDKACKDTAVQRLPYYVAHNTVIINKIYPTGAPYYTFGPQGINLNSLNYIAGSVVVNNLVVIDTNFNSVLTNPINGIYASNSVPGYSISYAPAFISVTSATSYGNNFYSNEITATGFTNWANQQFDLNPFSTAVNSGVGSAVSSHPFLNKDILAVTRPQGSSPDFGAYEALSVQTGSQVNNLTIVPNPVSLSGSGSTFDASWSDTTSYSNVQIQLVSSLNPSTTIAQTIQSVGIAGGKQVYTLAKSALPVQPGIYCLQLLVNGDLRGYANLMIIP